MPRGAALRNRALLRRGGGGGGGGEWRAAGDRKKPGGYTRRDDGIGRGPPGCARSVIDFACESGPPCERRDVPRIGCAIIRSDSRGPRYPHARRRGPPQVAPTGKPTRRAGPRRRRPSVSTERLLFAESRLARL
jgi:hypothetical protein